VHDPPTGPGWLHEIKHDGHRIIATVQGGVVRLSSRPGNDATKRFASVAEWLRQLPASTAIIDGEVAVPDERGVTHIDNLSETRHRHPIDGREYTAASLNDLTNLLIPLVTMARANEE
jgi:bifunctional non-homologous end joining protein LigD